VSDHANAPLTVFVDGRPVGPAPFTGQVAPGPHTVSEASDTFRAAPQTVTVENAHETRVELVASPITGTVTLQASDPLVVVTVDGTPVGQGTFGGELAIGTHDVTFSRTGFVSVARTIVVIEGRTTVEYANLTPSPILDGTPPIPKASGERRDPEATSAGIISSFALAATTQLNSPRSELSPSSCSHVGSDCREPTLAGGGLLWSVGYMWDHFGFDVPMGITIDQGRGSAVLAPTQSSTVSGLPSSLQAQACATGLAGCTSGGLTHFTFARAAGFIGVRARASYDVSVVRLVAATGIAIVDRVVGVAEQQSNTSGPLGGLTGGAAVNYASPAYDLDLEGASAKLALAVGVSLWIEDAGTARTSHLAADPSFNVARGTQVLLLPHLGLDFGSH
jgi:hypothetical protein